ncbi:hypothetical protein MY11210_003199 [Beauveria gryllotalpidicola]
MVGAPPLTGIKVLEFAGLAPGPFAGMMLADAGATVLRVNRHNDAPQDMLARHKASIAVDLKDAQGVALLRTLVASGGVDVLIDPFRPGVLERLGLGPEPLLRLNPRLVYARITGYRRAGRYAAMAGHDINYIGVSGALSLLGAARPQPPVNMLGDFAGGGATLFQGILLALLARATTTMAGRGQVVEANMVDGSSYLATFPRMARATPMGDKPRGQNLLDGGCPWYGCYATRDEKWVTVGALEPHFFAQLLRGLGIEEGQGWEEARGDEARWPELGRLFTEIFKSKTRSEWEAVFDGTDACVAPVLDYDELQNDETREGDQRPAVTLRETPWRAVAARRQEDDGVVAAVGDEDRGQGDGVEGQGYLPTLLDVGEGGDEVLSAWLGWKRGTHYEDKNGRGLSLINNDKAKI